MKYISNWNFLLVILLLSGISCKKQVNVYDGFEAPGLSKIWSTDRMVSNSFEIQSAIVRKGKSAAKITLRKGDTFEAGIGKSKSTERDELLEIRSLVAAEGIKYEYQFSMFLPDSFPIVNTRLVIAQWKQYCPKGICSDDSPVVALRYVSGELYVTLQNDSSQIKLYRLKDEIRNRWLDFRFTIRFSKQRNGIIEAFLNDKEIINYKGPVSYTEKRGYPSKNWYYFKMGLYRDLMPEPMTIFIDEYRKREIVE
ncbi:MAG: polysaccharide lyase [Bacteroidia bacterium]|nr:polysaccharide lyase [Bacteroidia bacterium]